MDSAPEFLNLFTESTGELLYFLVVFMISQAALLMALSQRLRSPSEVAAGRYTLLLTGVVLAWITLMGGALYALISDTPADAILPPLERAINALVIVLASAALLAADSVNDERGMWRSVALLSLLIIVGGVLTVLEWEPLAAAEEFNRHDLGFAWTVGTTVLLGAGLLLLLTRYRDTADVPLKVLFFLFLLAGYAYTVLLMSGDNLEGNASGALRLGFLAAMPMVVTVVYRLVVDRLTAVIDEISEYAVAVSRPQAAAPIPPEPAGRAPQAPFLPTSESMALLKAMGLMLEKEDPDSIPRQIVVSVASVLKADIAALISYEDDSWADIIAAYDNIQQRHIPGLALNLEEQPTVVNAIEQKVQRPLYPDRNLDELVDLYTRLDINQVGPAYIQPLTRNSNIVGILVVALPYTNREMTESEHSLLEGLAPIAARLLLLSRAAHRTRFEAEDRAIQAIVEGASPDEIDRESVLAARHEMQASLELAQEQIAELSRMVRDLQVELDYERSRMAQLLADGDEALTISQRIEALSKERQQLAAERELLSQALQEAQASLVSATAEGDEDVYASMIETLRRERDELQVQKAKLERQLEDIRQARETAVPTTLRAMLDELTEDKVRLTQEREQMKAELDSVYRQLEALGIEGGPLALAKTLGHLTEERQFYKTRAEKVAQERDLLLMERKKLTDQLEREAEREAKIAALEAEVRRLATDREALLKQRDATRAERDELLRAREAWLDHRTRLLGELSGLQAEMDEMMSELQAANAERQKATSERASLEAERDRLLAERTALQTERDQLLARVEGNRELLDQLGADGVGQLKTMIDELTHEREALKAQLDEAQQKLALLDHQQARGASGSTTQLTKPIAPENADVILSLAQELRTPMSSIMGYTDLLLAESVGILGQLQRQFLERVQANINRLNNLVEDLVSITALDAEDFKLQPVTIDMLAVIEDAITAAGAQFREKAITLHLNLADSLPPLRADHDAMQQVITQLLSNAYLASPPESEVVITARYERGFIPPFSQDIAPVAEALDGIYVAVTDQGGGVPPDEQRRVFRRLYRADNPLIEGLGDTGVGLSIAKALIEAHNGQIWFETELGKGSTFQFIIPLTPEPSASKEG